jgi:hypothetical protein
MSAGRSRVVPIVLIAVGVVFLLNSLDVIALRDLRHVLAKWWPLIPIGIGVWLLLERRG